MFGSLQYSMYTSVFDIHVGSYIFKILPAAWICIPCVMCIYIYIFMMIHIQVLNIRICIDTL